MERIYWNEVLETMPREQHRAWQLVKLQEHLRFVYEHSAYYRKSFAVAGVKPDDIQSLEDLAKLPTTSKMQFIADQKENPPYGDLLTCDPHQLVRIYWAPGPETIYFTQEDWDYTVDLGARTFFTNGVRSTDVVDVTSTYHWVIAGTLMDEAFRKVGAAVIPGGAGMTQMHVDVLRLTRATVIFVFPTFAEEIVKAAREQGIDPARDLNVRLAHLSGELRTEAQRTELEKAFGMVGRELYGTAEVPFVAAECDCGGGMHFEPRFIVEVVDPETGNPVGPDEKGELIVTDLTKRAQPIIRYRTGDITASVNYEPCPCGRTTPRMGRILGRASDIPRVKGLFIVPKQVGEVLAEHTALGRFQMIINRPAGERDTLTIRVEAERAAQTDSLRAVLVKALKDKIRITTEVELVDPGTIPADTKVVIDNRSAG